MKINSPHCSLIWIRLILLLMFGCFMVSELSAQNPGLSQDNKSPGLSIATFDVDATPPVGSYMAYGHVINTWDMSLRARGIVLMGAGKPIVLCSVDWIGIANDSQDEFKKVMAEAAGTVPERVALHTVHQHDAPICDFGAEKYLKNAGLDPLSYESTFTRSVMLRLGEAIHASLKNAQPFNQIGLGEAPVYMVASNRRILGPDGTCPCNQVYYMQGFSPACRA